MFHALLELTLLLAFWLVIQTSHRDRATGTRGLFIALTAAVFVWGLGVLLGLEDALAPVWVDRLSYAGVVCIPALWLGLALEVAGSRRLRRRPWLPLVWALPQLLAYALLWVPELAHWTLVSGPGGEVTLGPAWWGAAVWAWGLSLAGSAVLVRSALRGRRHPRASVRLGLALAALAPLCGNGVYVATGMQGPDPTPLLLCAALVVLRSALFAGDLLGGVPVSQHGLIEALPVPLLLTDRHGTVIAANRAAEARLGIDRRDAFLRSLDAVVREAREEPEVAPWPIVAAGSEIGSVVLLDSSVKRPGARAAAGSTPRSALR